MRRNLLFMGAATFARLISSVALFVIIARVLGPHEYGRLVFCFTVSTVLCMIVEYGHSTYVMKALGSEVGSTAELLSDIVLCKVFLTAVYALVVTLTAQLGLVGPSDHRLFALLCLAAALLTWGDFFSISFRGIDKFDVESRNVGAASIIHVLLVAPAAFASKDPIVIALAFAASRALYFAISATTFGHQFGPLALGRGLSHAVVRVRRQLLTTVAYATDGAIVAVRSYADVFFVHAFLGRDALGLYQAGMNCVRTIENIGPIAANAYLPKLSGCSARGDRAAFSRYSLQLLCVMSTCGAATGLAFVVAPDALLSSIFGGSYQNGFELFPLFGFYLFLRFVAMYLGVLLTAEGMQGFRVRAGLVSLVCLVSSAFALMPSHGTSGAVAANIIAAVVTVGMFQWRAYGMAPKARSLWLLAAVCTVAFVGPLMTLRG